MNRVREEFVNEANSLKSHGAAPKVLTVAVELPSGAVEVITNTEETESKIDYYLENYDSDFRLIANDKIQIVGFMIV